MITIFEILSVIISLLLIGVVVAQKSKTQGMTVTLAKVNIEKCELDFVPGKVESLADLQHMMDARAERRSGHQSNNKDKTGRTGTSIHPAGHKNVKSATAKKGKKTKKSKKSGKKTGKRK